jgi:riboflavin biosynthesis pyrimidine reductase/predicted DsbA family dithiol-disulfide isomerase
MKLFGNRNRQTTHFEQSNSDLCENREVAMPLKISVAHDFICPWCWVGLFQAKRLQEEFDVEIDWVGYELWPATLEWPESTPSASKPANKPETPSRLDFMLEIEGISIPNVEKPKRMKTFNAHQAVEYAKTEGCQDALNEALYRAYWQFGKEINNPIVIREVAEGIIRDIPEMLLAINENRFDSNVVDFDDDAYASGVYNVPTFFIGDQRLAEQPYKNLRNALLETIEPKSETDLYSDLVFTTRYEDRPYVFCNMVTTIDGKIITGERNEAVHDLGSSTDHFIMHRLESKADAILVGAHSLRATGNSWNPVTLKRIVISVSGNVPWDSEFLTKGEPIVLTTDNARFDVPSHVKLIRAGDEKIDWQKALSELKRSGIHVLNLLGGSETNATLITAKLVDELFMTLAPKMKLGGSTPTYADGEALTRENVQRYRLLSSVTIGEEIFLRYSR